MFAVHVAANRVRQTPARLCGNTVDVCGGGVVEQAFSIVAANWKRERTG